MEKFTFLATAAFGLEGIAKNELTKLGFDAKAENGGARFSGSLTDAFQANLQLRTADRVLLVLKEEKVFSFEELFCLVNSIPWEDYLPEDACFPVSGHCARSQLMSISDCQAITKKAIVERLKRRYNTSWFKESGAEYAISVTLHEDRARITLNTSGDALNKRGYRTWNGEAPLRETLAAAMVDLAPRYGNTPLHDPCCGSGTILIEAAFRMANRAPGLTRNFAMEKWKMTDGAACRLLRKEAQDRYDPSLIEGISGSDIDDEVLDLCDRHLKQAGIRNKVEIFKQDLKQLKLNQSNLTFITNPPYGERLGTQKSAEELYKEMSLMVRRHPSSRLCVLTAHHGFERIYGRYAQKKRRLYNGRLECSYLIF